MGRKIFTFVLFFIGAIVGFMLTASAGLFLYKKRQEIRAPKRFEVKKAEGFQRKFQDGFSVYVASSLDKIFQDGNTLSKPQFADSAAISLAGNEYEAFQVVVTTEKRSLRNAVLEFSDLTDPKSGKAVGGKTITWYAVGYVPTETPYYDVKYVGPYPDPLFPEVKTEIPEDQTQPFWVSVYMPSGTPAGTYNGTIRFVADGVTPREIPLTVRVYGFTLPRESSLKTAFDFYGHQTFKRYPQGDQETAEAYRYRLNEINDKFIVAMLQYRMNPVLNVDLTSDEELANVDRYRVMGLNNFSIGKRGGTFGNNWPTQDNEIADLEQTYRMYGELLRLNRLLPYAYIYTWDEGDIGNPLVAKVTYMIHRAYQGLKNMVCYHGFWDPDTNPSWGKDIDIWCFSIDDFNEKLLKRLQQLGKEMWMYVSGPAGYGAPNLVMDFESIDYRIIPWLCWKYDIRGFLYWCVNWWPNVDPFQSAKNSEWEQNGNGLLFYPGSRGPLPSVRVEIFRDGMEDYEYVQLLKRNLVKIKNQQEQGPYQKYFQESLKLLTVDDTIAASMTKFTKDGVVLEARRVAIAQKIEEFDTLFPKTTEVPVPVAPEVIHAQK